MSTVGASCRLYAILARDGRSAVVFRRGPSKQTCLVRWWLPTDEIDIGQWFFGRIYERRADLSPDGELLVYFAAKHSGPIGTWTAISRPPYFTALALWPKGDAWGGGGRFDSNRHLGLNHRPSAILNAGGLLPPNLSVNSAGPWAGKGEDNPIEHVRLERDGWRLVRPAPNTDYVSSAPAKWTFASPEIYEKPRPPVSRKAGPALTLRRELHAVAVVNGPFRDESFVLLDGDKELRRFSRCDWADWQPNGDLLLATNGCLYRLPSSRLMEMASEPLDRAELVADLRPLRFSPKPTSADAVRWPKGFGPLRPARRPPQKPLERR